MTVRQGAPKPTGFASTSGPRYERSTVQHFRRSSIVQRAPKATLKPNGTIVFARNVVIAKRSRGNGGDGKEVRPSTPSLLPITPPPPPPNRTPALPDFRAVGRHRSARGQTFAIRPRRPRRSCACASSVAPCPRRGWSRPPSRLGTCAYVASARARRRRGRLQSARGPAGRPGSP